MREGCVADRAGGPITIFRQEQLPELLRLDRIADAPIERMLREVVLRQDWRQQKRTDRAPFLVDIDRASAVASSSVSAG